MATYFITSATQGRRRLFQVARNAELFLETLQHYRSKGHFLLHAFVVMPDHIHLLLTPTNPSIERVMQFIKGGFSHRLGSGQPVWQTSFTESSITGPDDYLTRLNYIHQNPVRAHMVERPESYPYSSAHRQSQAPPRKD